LVVVEECCQRGQILDLVFFSYGTLVGVDQGKSKVDRFSAVMCEIHLTYYHRLGTVMTVWDNAPYVKEMVEMLINTGNALKLHEHRITELRQSAEKARLGTRVNSKPHSLKLGTYRLTLAKEARTHVPRMV